MNKSNNWDKAYKKGYRARYPNEDLIRFIQSHFPLKGKRSQIKVLDFGSGTGRHIVYLAKEGFNPYGIEAAAVGVELTKKWLKKEQLKADIRQNIGVKLPFDDNYFDAIIDCAAIQHNTVKEIKDIISELYRVLKNGGKIFSFCKSERDSLNGMGRQIEKRTFHLNREIETAANIHFFTQRELLSLWSLFKRVQIEHTERTINNMNNRVSHYLLTITK